MVQVNIYYTHSNSDSPFRGYIRRSPDQVKIDIPDNYKNTVEETIWIERVRKVSNVYYADPDHPEHQTPLHFEQIDPRGHVEIYREVYD